jgi:hypothetical protein
VIRLPVTSWFSAGTVANDTSTGSLSWDSDTGGTALVGNEVASDNDIYAYGRAASLTATNYLKCTNFGITNSDVPVGATIDGVEVEVRQFRGNTTPVVTSTSVNLVKAGSVVGSNFGVTADWAITETVVTYGGSAQLGGVSWTQSDVTSSGFGAALSVLWASTRISTSPNAYVDQVRLRINYTAAVVSVTVSSLSCRASGITYGVTAGSGGSVAANNLGGLECHITIIIILILTIVIYSMMVSTLLVLL